MGIKRVPLQNAIQKQLDSTLSAGATSLTLNEDISSLITSVSATNPGVLVIDRVDSSGNLTPSKREYITFTGVSTATLSGLTRNADSSGSDQEHAVGAIVEFVPDVLWAKSIQDTFETAHNADGTHKNGLVLTVPQINDTSSDHQYVVAVNELAADRTVTLPLLTGDDEFVFKDHTQTLTNKTLTLPQINDTSSDHQYVFAVSELSADRTVTLPLLTGNDEFVFKDFTQTLTNKTLTSPTITSPSLTTFSTLYLPVGSVLNGRIVPSVTSNNLTVALKGLDGNDPSASNPVYVRIGDTIRTISSALSVTTNAGTNWFGSGGTDFATRERDYFVYLGYNATDGVVIGFALINHARTYGDFSTTNTNEKYCAISTITNAASTDSYTVIGRFAATLGATASFNWSVPTFTTTNLIQRPIYETRTLTSGITFGGFSSAPTGTFSYKLVNDVCFVDYADATGGTSNATTFTATLPFAPLNSISNFHLIVYKNNGSNSANIGHIQSTAGSRTIGAYTSFYQGAWASANGKDFYFAGLNYRI